VNIEVQSKYPFEDQVIILINPDKDTEFPVYLRIPAWVSGQSVLVNDQPVTSKPGEFLKIERKWKTGDRVVLNLASKVRTETRYRKAVAVARGPLYFSLRIPKTYSPVILKKSYQYKGSTDWQIEPAGDWNYGLMIDPSDPAGSFEVVTGQVGEYPFGDSGDPVFNPATGQFDTLDANPPVMLKARGIMIPEWGLQDFSAGPVPYSPVEIHVGTEKFVETDNYPSLRRQRQPQMEIELVPYGSARLRVSEFPVAKKTDDR
jgi:hypothetical protein